MAGLNVTEIAHEFPFASEVPQLFVSAKSVGFAPPRLMLVIESVPVPVFVSVATCAVAVLPAVVVGKAMPATGVSVTCGTTATLPVPLSVTVDVETLALSVTVIVAGRLTAVCGLKLTVNAHELPTASDAPQVVISA